MTAPETGSMADYDDLADAIVRLNMGATREAFDISYDAMRGAALRCGMPIDIVETCVIVAWSRRRLATYRAMMERG